ncbi:MAG: tyrosine-type recombinase/integrase [Lachnospiraceae bacterium]|nr:tyrosine-type recombinase/integrase [Candidatus Darwinimomas equi]
MSKLTYSEETDKKNIQKLRTLLLELPPYCKDFFRGIEPNTQSRTRIAYAYDLNVFFTFLMNSNPSAQKFGDIKDIPLEFLDNLQPIDIEEYMEYLKYRDEDGKEIFNKEQGILRKISSLRSFYNYFYRTSRIDNNPTQRILMPKLHEKPIIRLDIDEVASMIDQVESGEQLSAMQKRFHDKTKIRDVAIITLLLGTGIRVSECVGLNITDVDFINDGIRVHRKGGKESTVYFGDEVESALKEYIEQRKHILAADGSEEALFLSLQNKRVSVRSIENLVKKYARIVTPLKKITPHKLRSTYGTSLYRETGDIYLVAEVLGHNDVNTTRKHYAALEDQRKRSVRNAVKLRED